MTRTAKFSNGFERTYKGDRDVKAAWMITDATGEVLTTGFSMDNDKAQKTAEGKCTELGVSLQVTLPNFYWLPRSLRQVPACSAKHVVSECRKAGLANDVPQGKLRLTEAFRRMKEATKAYNQACRDAATIEVINL